MCVCVGGGSTYVPTNTEYFNYYYRGGGGGGGWHHSVPKETPMHMTGVANTQYSGKQMTGYAQLERGGGGGGGGGGGHHS